MRNDKDAKNKQQNSSKFGRQKSEFDRQKFETLVCGCVPLPFTPK